jgi:glycosyltransferase involved in cell wall biosynthesis
MSEWLERFLYHHADEMVVNSPGFISHISQRGARHITLIENGVDVSMFDTTETGSEFRKAYHLENKFIALYAGAHGISNNLGIILRSAAISLDNPDIVYIFVGDGKEKSNLIEEANTKQLTNVLFVPSVPKSEMNSVLAAANACIAILKPIEMYKTTYPNKVFDYMAASKPVLLLIDGVIREVVEDAKCGVFVEPGNPYALADQIKIMHNDAINTERMGKNGRKYVEQHFDRATLAAKMEDVFNHLLRNNEK